MSKPLVPSPNATQNIALFDGRPFFEKTLIYGLQHGLIDRAKLDAIRADAPKGMVQIARYFGSEFLRPELEKAKDRIVNLVSLNLELASGGDLHKAAEVLRDHSFMSRSKAASDMLKALIVMPKTSHFGMNEQGSFRDEHIPLLAKWTLCSLPDYQDALAQRRKVGQVVDAAMWLAARLGLDLDDLEAAACDAEAIIRTALMALAVKQTQWPDWVAFQRIVVFLRKKAATLENSNNPNEANRATIAFPIPAALPREFRPIVQAVRESLLADLPKMQDAAVAPRKLFAQTPAFIGRYYWTEDALSEVNDFDREASAAWNKATAGHSDDSSLLTLFLCIAAGSPKKTLVTDKAAASLVRKIRKGSWAPQQVAPYIESNAPEHLQNDYLALWRAFCEEAESILLSDHDPSLYDAMALLRRECNVSGS